MIETKNLVRTFKNGDVVTSVLKGIDFKVEDGEFIAIMGRSGAGKSTLLYQISLLDEPTSGEIVIDGHDTHTMTADEKMQFRLTKFGYVFQDYALLPELTALENVALPLLMQGKDRKTAYAESTGSLSRVGLSHRLHSLPSRLSGGEQQRVSIARAVAHDPSIIFADEPTANLDNESSRAVLDIFRELHKHGQTIIMVTHEEPFANEAQAIVRLDDGKITSITRHSHVH
ncbi:MAG: ABC transporter ATP-binding protein [Candidatus Paceibacterota bacterium]